MSNFNDLFEDFKDNIKSLERKINLISEGLKHVESRNIREAEEWGKKNLDQISNLNELKDLNKDKKEELSEFIINSFEISSFIPEFLRNQRILSVYTYFEALLKDFLQEAYLSEPKILSNKEIKMKMVLDATEIDEIIYNKIEKEVNKLQGGIVDIIKKLMKELSIEYSLTGDNQRILKEFTNVRNLIAHRAGKMDKNFLNRYPEYSILEIKDKYLLSKLERSNPIKWLRSIGDDIIISEENVNKFSDVVISITREISSLISNKFSKTNTD